MLIEEMVVCLLGWCVLLFGMWKWAPDKLLRGFGFACLLGWAAVTAYVTILSRDPVMEMRIHLTPFTAETGGDWRLYDMIENVVLFVPWAGASLCLFPRMKPILCVACGMAASLMIELIQLVTHRGICDVDDLIANSIGVVLGLILWALCVTLSKRRH